MAREKILLVDDDKNITEILEFNLKSEGYEVTTVYSAEEALKLAINDFGIILLDVMMAGMSGYKFAEKIRDIGIAVPIIFLTAKDTENDLLTGFSVGGDDYISKPFSIKEVTARIQAILKRSSVFVKENPNNNIIEIGNLTIDTNLKEVLLENIKINLTKTEFELLVLLAKNPNSIFSRERIISKIWVETLYITERTVDVHIARLRKKLGKYADAIINRSGYGYHFNSDAL